MSERPPTADDSARTPFAGCLILIIAMLVMLFLVIFSTNVLFRQFDEIAKFTSDKPNPVEVNSLENQESSLVGLAERLELFRQALAGEDECSLALSPEEMNLAIAAYEPFKELRHTFRVLSVDDSAMRIAIAFPLNGKPRLARSDEKGMVASDSRYLNATMVAKPTLLQSEVVLKLDAIDVPGASVPKEFIEQMSPYRITERYLNDGVIGPVMRQLTQVTLADGKLVLTRVPGEIPADKITDNEVDSATSRLFSLLGVLACGFLIFAGIIIFIGLRTKNRRAAK